MKAYFQNVGTFKHTCVPKKNAVFKVSGKVVALRQCKRI